MVVVGLIPVLVVVGLIPVLVVVLGLIPVLGGAGEGMGDVVSGT